MPVNERDLCFFDTETTGFELDKELLEIGAVRVKANTFEKLSEIDIKIKPQHIENATPEALEVVGYDEAEWEKEGMDLRLGTPCGGPCCPVSTVPPWWQFASTMWNTNFLLFLV